MKKVLFFMHMPPPIHGVTVCNKIIADSELVDQAFDKRILPIRYGESIRDMQGGTARKLLVMAVYFLKLLFYLVFFRPDVIYFTISPLGGAFYRDVVFVFLMKLFRRKIVYHLHGKGISEVKNKVDLLLYRTVFNNSTIVCLSELLSYDVNKVKGNANVVICANGIDYTPICKGSSRSDRKNVVFISNLSRVKGIDKFLEVVSRASKEELPLDFHLVGPFSNVYTEDDLNEFVESNPWIEGNLKYYGAMYDSGKMELLESMDILLYPTRNDAFPLVVLEAMATGNVIISSKVGGIPDILRDVKGSMLVDMDEFYPALLSLIEEDESLSDFQKSSMEVFNEKFTVEKFEKRIRDILLNV